MINRLKELREAAGMTQAELARKLNTTDVSISRYEREPQRISIPLMFDLARALGCAPSAIITPGPLEQRKITVALPLRGQERHVHFDREVLRDLGEEPHLMAFAPEDEAMEPLLPKGAVCVVDTSQTRVQRDGLYVVRIGSLETVRRVMVQLNGELKLAGEHPLYREAVAVRPDDLTVAGRVVWVGRRV